MEPKELCEKFIAADKIINDQIEGNLTMEGITNYPNFNKYCSNSECEIDMQINGLSEDLFDQLGTEIEDEYYEYFAMWLSDKLFKIVNEDDNSQINDITLNEAYEKYLKKNIKNEKYWSLLDIKEGLKEVNLKYMKHFYKLLNDICKAIVHYKLNNDDIEKFINKSSDCSNQYSSLYNSVPKCDSYLHLLDNLKKTYEDFKNSVHNEIKNEYRDLAERLQTLTIENANSYFVGKIKAFDFSDSKCKLETKLPPLPPQLPSKPTTVTPPPVLSKEPANPAQQTQPQSFLEKDTELKKTQTEGPSHKNGPEDSKSKQQDSENSKRNTGDTPGNKENSNSETGSSGGGKDSGGGYPGSGENYGAKEPGDQDVTDPSGVSNGGWLGNLGMSFNLTGYMSSVSGIYESSKNILTNTANQVSNAYNSAMNIAQDTYDKTVDIAKNAYGSIVSTVKDTYTRSTNYISDAVNSITIQFNPFGTSQLGDNQSGPNSLGGGVDTSNQSQTNPKQPVNPPPPPSLPPSPSPQSPPQPQSNQIQDPSQTPPDPQAPSPSITLPLSPSNTQTPSDPPSLKSLDPQPIPTHNSKCPIQQIAPTDGNRVSQIPLSAQGTLSSYSTDPSAQGNGSTTGIVKMNEKTSIWCIGSNNKCGIMGISIIVISISIILTIIYKYLSLGCTSKSKRKKSVKKVINSIGGKRPIQIIIKSYDRNKDLKPVINSV
ncbi:hypothetical protein YYG_04630, partial [Plasmodium vinckei petteri]